MTFDHPQTGNSSASSAPSPFLPKTKSIPLPKKSQAAFPLLGCSIVSIRLEKTLPGSSIFWIAALFLSFLALSQLDRDLAFATIPVVSVKEFCRELRFIWCQNAPFTQELKAALFCCAWLSCLSWTLANKFLILSNWLLIPSNMLLLASESLLWAAFILDQNASDRWTIAFLAICPLW